MKINNLHNNNSNLTYIYISVYLELKVTFCNTFILLDNSNFLLNNNY